jgi:hypothetical protein
MRPTAPKPPVGTSALANGSSEPRLRRQDRTARRADRTQPTPVLHQAHGSEQIALDHERVEAPDALLRVDPVRHLVVLDRGSDVVRYCPRVLPQPPPASVWLGRAEAWRRDDRDKSNQV